MDDVTKWLETQLEASEAQAYEEMIESAADGYDAWRTVIETSHTGMEWSKKWWKTDPERKGSFDGRIWTGTMIDSVEIHPAGNSVEVGFVSGFQPYFEDQEVGFETPEGVPVEGMHAQAVTHMVIDDALMGKGWKKQ